MLRGSNPGGQSSRGNYPGGNFPRGKLSGHLFKDRKKMLNFLKFSGQ